MAIDLRTEKQKQRDAVHAQIIADYLRTKKAAASASNYQVFIHVGKLHGYTPEGVRRVLVAHNVTI